VAAILAGAAAFAATVTAYDLFSHWALLMRFVVAGLIVVAVYVPALFGLLAGFGIRPSVFYARMRGAPNPTGL